MLFMPINNQERYQKVAATVKLAVLLYPVKELVGGEDCVLPVTLRNR
jgi:hypothetical protein